MESKKRRVNQAADVGAKKAKASAKQDKGKSKAATEFRVVRTSMVLSVSPVFSGNPRVGFQEMLDGMLMRYIPALGGVVLAHTNLAFPCKAANILADCPFLVCKANFDATVWSPEVGMKLTGKINLCSPDHISLLVHRTFNVSIPRHHIPAEYWEFEYGAVENDPEFGPAAQVIEENTEEGQGKTEELEASSGDSGRWIHRLTAEPLGGKNNFLEFTVIGFTVANEMLSLLGSIQLDPFSPLHIIQGVENIEEERVEDDVEILEDDDWDGWE